PARASPTRASAPASPAAASRPSEGDTDDRQHRRRCRLRRRGPAGERRRRSRRRRGLDSGRALPGRGAVASWSVGGATVIADLVCSTCGSDDVDLLDVLSDGSRRVSCVVCGSWWVRGAASTPTCPRPLPTFGELRTTCTSPADVARERVEHARRFKVTYLAGSPTPDPAVAPFWAKYQRIFS